MTNFWLLMVFLLSAFAQTPNPQEQSSEKPTATSGKNPASSPNSANKKDSNPPKNTNGSNGGSKNDGESNTSKKKKNKSDSTAFPGEATTSTEVTPVKSITTGTAPVKPCQKCKKCVCEVCEVCEEPPSVWAVGGGGGILGLCMGLLLGMLFFRKKSPVEQTEPDPRKPPGPKKINKAPPPSQPTEPKKPEPNPPGGGSGTKKIQKKKTPSPKKIIATAPKPETKTQETKTQETTKKIKREPASRPAFLAGKTIETPSPKTPFRKLYMAIYYVHADWESYKRSPLPAEDIQRFSEQTVRNIPTLLELLDDIHPSDSDALKKWIQFKLLATLDGIAQIHSVAALALHRGNTEAQSVYQWLDKQLYIKINSALKEYKWFQLEVIQPFQTYFDINKHQSIESVSDYGPNATDKIIRVERVGLLNLDGTQSTRAARVIVGD